MRPGLGAELAAGAISAVVMLPQAVVLATLAGMPPEHGIYASVFPPIVASVFGSNRLVLSGPNTTIALMSGSLVASIAALHSAPYAALMLFIGLLVGLIQLGLGLVRGARLLRFLPPSAFSAVTTAVGLTIVMSQLSTVTGILYLYDDAAWINALRCMIEVDGWDMGALLTGLVTLAAAVAVGRRTGKFAIPAAMAGGTLAALLWTTASGQPVEMLGRLDVKLLAPSLPRWSSDYLPYCVQIAVVGLSIAFVGLLQTAVIARSLTAGHAGRFDLGREIRAQGLANLCAAFTSGMPVSGSFNRSAAHVAAGARSALAGIVASVLLLLAACFGAGIICFLPLPVMGGMLLYIGWTLVDKAELRAVFTRFDGRGKQFLVVTLCGVSIGITAAVLAAAALAVVVYLRHAATPRITCECGSGRIDWCVTFEGDLFFGSVQPLEDALDELRGARADAASVKLVLRAAYIDRDGHALLAREQQRWAAAGVRLHILLEGPATGLATAIAPGRREHQGGRPG